jgi:hypothetical protein
MTLETVLHLDARYKALHKAGSRDTEAAFLDWRLAAVEYAEERRPTNSTGEEHEHEGETEAAA